MNLKKGFDNNENSGGELGVWLGGVSIGSMLAAYGVAGGWGVALIAACAVGGFMEIKRKYHPYKRLFEKCGLDVDGETPYFKQKIKTSYGYSLRFNLTAGLSTDDFEKKKLAIEQYIKKRVEIGYNNRNVFINVYEKELESNYIYNYTPTQSICEFPIGYIYGDKLLNVDLESVVHMLIAGETGSGKSTLLRGILTNLILDKSTRSLSLHLIDLKNGAEFNVFRKCGMVKSFSRTIGEAENILIKLSKEVDRRYDLFFNNDVVNIQEYNVLKLKRLDYQIVVIDEFADLQDEKGSISIIETLAAKARACGIHIIIATQRPDARILNGRIKANIPCVIGLKTMNELNSRVIIDDTGLEKLRGKGHGYLKYSDMTEFQAPYLSVNKARELLKDKYINRIRATRQPEPEIIGEVEDFGFLKNLIK